MEILVSDRDDSFRVHIHASHVCDGKFLVKRHFISIDLCQNSGKVFFIISVTHLKQGTKLSVHARVCGVERISGI